MIRLAEARKSVAITGAPFNVLTPSTITVFPSTRMDAPMRFISWTCMNLFSNTVSVIDPVPFATEFKAVNWACMSVGNAG